MPDNPYRMTEAELQARPERKGMARVTSLLLLAPVLFVLGVTVASRFADAPPAVDAGLPGTGHTLAADCPGGTRAARPEHLVLVCGDGAITSTITWHTWDDTGATGNGFVTASTCRPDCASGRSVRYPATFRMVEPTLHGSQSYFSTMEIMFTAATPWKHQVVRCPLDTPEALGGCGGQLTS